MSVEKVKIAEIRTKSKSELMEMLLVLKKEVFAARMSGGRVMVLRALRRQVARVMTVLSGM